MTNDIPWRESDFHKTQSNMHRDHHQHQANKTDDDDDEDNDDMFAMFADPDPLQEFEFEFHTSKDNDDPVIRIQLQGQKQENGQTLHSTGLTLWRASELLCDYLIQQPHLVKNQRVLEVC